MGMNDKFPCKIFLIKFNVFGYIPTSSCLGVKKKNMEVNPNIIQAK